MPQRVTLSWHFDMPLAGKLVLSALLLLTLAYRLYKSRLIAGGKIPRANEEHRENAARDGDGDGDDEVGLRRRRLFGEEVRRGGGDAQVSGTGTLSTPFQWDWSLLKGGEEEEMVSELELTGKKVGVGRRASELGSRRGGETGIEPGSDLGSELARKAESEAGNKLGSEVGREPGSEAGNKLGSEVGREPGSEAGNKLGSAVGREPGSEAGNKLGSEVGREPGSEAGNKLGSAVGREPGSEAGNKLGSEVGREPGSEAGNKLGSEVGREPGSEAGNKLGSEVGREPGSEAGNKLGSELSCYEPGDASETLSSSGEDTLAPSIGLSPRAANDDDSLAQSMEQDLASRGMSQEVEEHGGMIQTLSVTSDLALTMTTSGIGSDTSYSFSSVAKIQVEEGFITEQRVKDGSKQPGPGLKGKVYDYYAQSISQSVSKKRSVPYISPGTSQGRSSEWVNEGTQNFATPEPDPTLAMQNRTTSSIVPASMGTLEPSPEPPSPGRKNSIVHIAESPHLQLPMEGFGVTAPVDTLSASPRPGLVTSSDQMPPSTHLDLGNCYKVLCTAKAQKLHHLQEAAYKVMSDNYLQVLRTPSIYSRLNAGERDLILRLRMKGKMHMVMADVNLQELRLHSSRLCYYDDGEDSWHHLCHMPPEVVSQGCAMCSMFNYLFVVAGCKGMGRMQRPSNRVFCYDPLTNIWREICPLNQARPHCKLVALDGHLYAIGGECLYTVERYDPRQDRWTFTAPLPHDTFAVAHTATVCDGEIYVTGGTLRYVLLRYTARSDSWRVSPASGGKNRTAEMVSTNGFIYRFDLHRGTGIGVYRCSAKAKLWYECATYTMANPGGFQCAVVGSLVHCVGQHFHIRFLADHISPRFGTKELQRFPSPHGSLLPAVLMLPEGGMPQTQV